MTNGKTADRQLLREGIITGVLIGLGVATVWACVVVLRDPEPLVFLAAIRHQDGQEWDIRACADCPSFLLVDRGFGSPHDALLVTGLAIASLPSVLIAVDRSRASSVPELSPALFFVALILQWILAAVVIRWMGAMLARRHRARLTA